MKERMPKLTKKDGAILGAFAFSQAADAGTTIMALRNGASEGNKILNYIMQDYGEAGLFLVKLAGIIIPSSLYLKLKDNDIGVGKKKIKAKKILNDVTAIEFLISVSNVVLVSIK